MSNTLTIFYKTDKHMSEWRSAASWDCITDEVSLALNTSTDWLAIDSNCANSERCMTNKQAARDGN